MTHELPAPAGAELRVEAQELGRRHLRGSTLLLAGRLLSILLTVATQVIIVRTTTKEGFGAFALALTIASASRLLLSLGQGKTLSRFLAIDVEEQAWGRLFGSVLIAAGTVLALGGALLATLFLLRDQLDGTIVDGRTAVTVLLIVVLLAPLEALDQVFVSVFAVLTRPSAIFWRKYLFTPGLRLVVVVAVALAHGTILTLAVGYVAAQLLGVLLYVAMLRGVLAKHGLLGELRWSSLSWPFRSVVTFALPMLSAELVYLSMNTVSVLVLSATWGTVEVADLRAIIPAVTLNKIVYSTFVTLYLPMASRLFARGDHRALLDDYWRTAAFLAVMSFPVFAMTGPFALATTVTLFGERYESSAVLLSVMAIGYYLNSALGFNLVTLQAYGRVKVLFAINVFCAVGNLVLVLVLVPDLGAMGVAVATSVTLLAQNALNQWALRRATGSPWVDRRYWRTYGSLAAATVVLVAVQLWFQPGAVAAVVWTGLVGLLLVVVNRSALQLAESFPELLRVPGVRWIVAGRR